jgi:hypothetical protein
MLGIFSEQILHILHKVFICLLVHDECEPIDEVPEISFHEQVKRALLAQARELAVLLSQKTEID